MLIWLDSSTAPTSVDFLPTWAIHQRTTKFAFDNPILPRDFPAIVTQ
jgi:hypothetical protein